MPDAKPFSAKLNQPLTPAGNSEYRSKRRILLHGLLIGALGCRAHRALGQSLTATPAQTEGPFYPDKLPLE